MWPTATRCSAGVFKPAVSQRSLSSTREYFRDRDIPGHLPAQRPELTGLLSFLSAADSNTFEMNPAPTSMPRSDLQRRAVTSLRSWLVPAILGLVLLAAFIEIAAIVSAGGWVVGADHQTLEWFVSIRSQVATAVAEVVAVVADPVGTAVTATIFAGWLIWRRRDLVGAGYVVATLAVSGLGIVVSKAILHRLRPPLATQLIVETNGSFPSGHVTGAVMIYGCIAIVIIRISSPGRSLVAGALALGAVIAVGVDRLYLGVHWLSDLFGSILLGSSLLLLCTAVWLATMPQTTRWVRRHNLISHLPTAKAVSGQG